MLDGQKRCEITAARAQPKSMKSCCENRMHRILIAAHFVMVFFPAAAVENRYQVAI
jgi:hypothetical protein